MSVCMIKRMNQFILTTVLFLFAAQSYAGIVVGGTRIIFPGDAPDATISIFNKETTLPYLIQVWVDPFDKQDKSKPPFTAIPPVSRLEPRQEKTLRIVKVAGELPKDRESVFWLNIKNIPPSSDKKDTSTLEIAIKTRIKMFWRPASIKLTPEKAFANVKWHRQGKQLVMENPNPIHINIMSVSVDGKDVPLNMIRPFETLTLNMPEGVGGHSLVWRFINDYGAISDPVKVAL
ncbi:fimbrial chaperone [Salmonella enterica subsp. enterica]|nr:fimbrial chaperone [Salmonella enterica subsp. enterica serovar Kambole]ECH9429843.1 fimbrial chaperone [Salmonella enterica subsp. enterica]EBG0730916.1 fimbrial chaperone [Salmonella enterica subsp. enterica serovar Kambole]EBS2657558.1 fimbrial chaperone protein [Salmonella enterica subsp. enterica serovar Kambole]EBY4019181.1 fimbrial chaperone [Salmonella enterica subsp. enterica serovar Kambole]